MLWDTIKSARDLGRVQEIATVLIRYGFGDMVKRLGMSRMLERTGRALRWKDAEALAHMEPPARICRVLEDLGPAYIKLGQLLATRVDLFPPHWIAEFEKLQDQIPPLSFERLRHQLEEDLGGRAEDILQFVDTQPLAAASIAQVHRARLPDGTNVVLKIRRPGIEATIDADLRLLARLAEIAEKNVAEIKRYRPTEIVRQFTLSMRRELNFTSEGRHGERIAANFRDDPDIVIPKIYWPWTRERLLVQQFIDGIPGRNIAAVEAAGLDRKLLAAKGAEAVLRMTLVDGFFHADPHLGNFFYLDGNRIALIDFGMVGRLSDERRDQVIDLFYALVNRHTADVVEVLQDWAGDVSVDTDVLSVEIDTFLDHYHGIPLKDLDFAAMLRDLVAVLRDHQLVLPPDLALLMKAFLSLDGVGRRLDPDFDIVSAASPFLQRIIMARYAPDRLAKRTWRNATSILDILFSLPADVRRLLRSARRGSLQINVDLVRLDHFGHQLDRAASRITIGLITAAIIVGTSIVITVGEGPRILGMPVFGFFGFLAACLGGLAVLLSISRGRRD